MLRRTGRKDPPRASASTSSAWFTCAATEPAPRIVATASVMATGIDRAVFMGLSSPFRVESLSTPEPEESAARPFEELPSSLKRLHIASTASSESGIRHRPTRVRYRHVPSKRRYCSRTLLPSASSPASAPAAPVPRQSVAPLTRATAVPGLSLRQRTASEPGHVQGIGRPWLATYVWQIPMSPTPGSRRAWPATAPRSTTPPRGRT